MDFDDLLKMRGLENMDEKKDHSGRWSENTALWAIVIAIVIIAWLWFVHRQGADKADLAATVQSSVSRLNALESATTAQGQNLYSINSVLSATTQAVGDFKAVTNQQLAALQGLTLAVLFDDDGDVIALWRWRQVREARQLLLVRFFTASYRHLWLRYDGGGAVFLHFRSTSSLRSVNR